MRSLRLSLALLAAAAVALWLSDLRFAWSDGLRFWLLLAGGALGLASLVAGLLAKTWKARAVALAAIVGAAALTLALSGPLAHTSHRLYVRQHGAALTHVASLLQSSRAEYVTRWVCSPSEQASPSECAGIVRAMEEAGVSIAARLEGGGAMLELYGFLDNRGGLIYCDAAGGLPACGWEQAEHLSGPWYLYHT